MNDQQISDRSSDQSSSDEESASHSDGDLVLNDNGCSSDSNSEPMSDEYNSDAEGNIGFEQYI